MLPLIAWRLRNGQARAAAPQARGTESKAKPAAKPQPAAKANGKAKKPKGAAR